MACVGLITFAEMGSSHSLHYVLYSEDDSSVRARVSACVRACVHARASSASSNFERVCSTFRLHFIGRVNKTHATCPRSDVHMRVLLPSPER